MLATFQWLFTVTGTHHESCSFVEANSSINHIPHEKEEEMGTLRVGNTDIANRYDPDVCVLFLLVSGEKEILCFISWRPYSETDGA